MRCFKQKAFPLDLLICACHAVFVSNDPRSLEVQYQHFGQRFATSNPTPPPGFPTCVFLSEISVVISFDYDCPSVYTSRGLSFFPGFRPFNAISPKMRFSPYSPCSVKNIQAKGFFFLYGPFLFFSMVFWRPFFFGTAFWLTKQLSFFFSQVICDLRFFSSFFLPLWLM